MIDGSEYCKDGVGKVSTTFPASLSDGLPLRPCTHCLKIDTNATKSVGCSVCETLQSKYHAYRIILIKQILGLITLYFGTVDRADEVKIQSETEPDFGPLSSLKLLYQMPKVK